MDKQIEERIDEYVNNLKKIRDEEFKKYNYNYEEYIFKKKLTKQRRIEQIEHQKKIRKQVLINRNKAARKEVEEYVTIDENNTKDILTDNLFFVKAESEVVKVEGEEVKPKRIKKKFEEVPKEDILKMMDKYILKRRIKLNKEDMDIIIKMKEDESVEWKKYISLTTDGTDITKISFLKKNGMGDDIIDFTEEEKLTTEERKVQSNRKKLLNKF